MGFITRFSARLIKVLRHAVAAACLFAMANGAAAGIQPHKAAAQITDNSINVSARFNVSLTPALEQALQNGLSLPFTYEFQLVRPRVYAWFRQLSDWFEPTATLTKRLSYHALTRQYRVSQGGFSRSFATLPEALAALGIIGGWSVLETAPATRDPADFAGRVRLRLDLSLLPKPYQLAALGQSEWRLESAWLDFPANRGDNGTQQ
ncbi:protein of unknown function [Formivibrio citricus]|uniref:DUF4390 domain-containing protein n=1 Tax=Formivibrio citricus TaxID=83765 RepID=A0A1I4XYJ5_9NEIS|nr:DUF4390 domain-containing protein [Formivibrio citricus]SFN30865.1 protein of unknown function [Formivibrio citricus]